MAALVHPILFGAHFGFDSANFISEGLIEPILNCDTPLFIDPTLIQTSGNIQIANIGYKDLRERFENIIRLVDVSEAKDDVAWRAALKLVDISEFSETGLGYGGSGVSGSSRPDEMRDVILDTIAQIIRIGEKDPGILTLVGLFDEGIGPDTISDLTSHAIKGSLIQLSADFYAAHGLPTRVFNKYDNAALVPHPDNVRRPILLVPTDIIRALPLANDWSDVGHAISQIEEIRERFNSFFTSVAKPTITDRKRALRKVAFESKDNLTAIVAAILSMAGNYDTNEDIFNYYAIREILSGKVDTLPPQYSRPLTYDMDGLLAVVRDIIDHYKKQIEHNNLWEMLWHGSRPKRERASQLLFYAVADVFCKANNLDVTPEANMGGGPVDFKFSSGYDVRVVVELKKSNGTVEHGYSKQLEVYKEAAGTKVGIFVVIDVGGMGKKLINIKAARDKKIQAGESASDIFVIDGKRKPSASKA